MVNDRDTLTVDQMLLRVGEFGRFQKCLDALFFIMNIPVACQIFITYFATITPSWRCRNESLSCLYNLTLPGDDNRRCELSRSEWYYTESREYSFVTQFELDCGKEWILQLISSIYFIGWASGGIVLGWFGDMYGRKKILYPSIIITITAGFITSFLKNVYVIIVIRYVIGFFNPGSTLQAFILISEYVGSRQRPFAGIIVYLALPVGYIFVAVKAYLTKNWKILYIICTIPYIVPIAFYKFVPESVKWLLLHGKTDDIKVILRRIASWNRSDLPEDIDIKSCDEIPVQKTSLLDIFRTRKLVIHSLVQGSIWLVTGITYFGLSLAADDLGGSAYRDFIILSVFELPALVLAIDFCTRFGRKPSTLIPLFLGGASCILVVLIPAQGKVNVLRILIGLLGKFCLSITFDAVYTWSVEIYPTSTRSKGMGFLQATSHFGSGAAPFIAKGLKPVAKWLPFVVMGLPAMIGAILGMLLPETRIKKSNEASLHSHDNLAVVVDDAEMERRQ